MDYSEKWKKYQAWLADLVKDTRIPLFDTDENNLIKTNLTNNGKTLILRHPLMEKNVIEECSLIHKDYENQTEIYDGLMSFIYIIKGKEIIPLFFCQSGKFGRDKKSLNQNLKDTLPKSKIKYYFARWGDNGARHIGELSNAMFDNGEKPTPRKIKWRNHLFNETQNGYELKTQVFFFAKAWSKSDLDYYGNKVVLEDLVNEIVEDFHPILMGANDPEILLMDFNKLENFDLTFRLEFCDHKWQLTITPQFFHKNGISNSFKELISIYPSTKKTIDDLILALDKKNIKIINEPTTSLSLNAILDNEQTRDFLINLYPNEFLQLGYSLETDILSIYKELTPKKTKKKAAQIKSQIFQLEYEDENDFITGEVNPRNNLSRITLNALLKIQQKISLKADSNLVIETADDKKVLEFEKLIQSVKPSLDYSKFFRQDRVYSELDPPNSFLGRLFDFQKIGLGFLSTLCDNGVGALLCDDMGLGKTIQSIAYLHHRNAKFGLKKVLIISPASVIVQWQNEIKKYSNDLFHIFLYHGAKRHALLNSNQNTDRSIFITTYSTLAWDIDLLKTIEWDGIIVDEIHRAKTIYTNISTAILQLHANFRIAMTGTPIENSIADLYPILQFLNPGYLGTFEEFKANYLNPIRKEILCGNYACKELQELKIKVGKILIRRTKEELREQLNALPIKEEIEIMALMTPQQEDMFESIGNDFIQNRDSRDKLYLITKLKQLCNHPALVSPIYDENYELSGKMIVLFEKLEKIINNSEKVVIFTQYKEMIKILKNQIKMCFDSDVFEISGDTPPQLRQKIVAEFNGNPKHKVMIISLMAGGEGINLNTAKHLILYDSWWNFSKEQQAKDRIFRINQENSEIFVYKLWTKNSIEEHIIRLINHKKEISEELLQQELIEDIPQQE